MYVDDGSVFVTNTVTLSVFLSARPKYDELVNK
jgi:hypothetical protein